MPLSPQNEAYLKSVFKSNNKDLEIQNISDKIQDLEVEMASTFDDGYLDVISKCSVFLKNSRTT